MKQITLNIAENKFNAFIEFVKTLDFVQIDHLEDSKESILSNIDQGLRDAKSIEEGNLKTRPAQQLLNEL